MTIRYRRLRRVCRNCGERVIAGPSDCTKCGSALTLTFMRRGEHVTVPMPIGAVLVKSCEVCGCECSFILLDKAYCAAHLPPEWHRIGAQFTPPPPRGICGDEK